MEKMIFVNLPVADLSRSVAFYAAIGFTKNDQFSDETAACMVLSDAIYVMLLTHDKWKSFTDRPICPPGSSEVSLALALEDRDAVDRFVGAGAAHGGIADVNPMQDLGFMYGRDIADPDGHVWGPFFMDMSAASPETSATKGEE